MNRRTAPGLVVLGLLIAGCSSHDQAGSARERFRSWETGTGLGASIATIRQTTGTAASVLNRTGTPNEAHTVCASLLIDIQTANDNLPGPDSTLTVLLGKAYNALGTAANACYDAPTKPSSAALFAAKRHEGIALLAQAEARAVAILGGPLSTATTVVVPGQ
jgi:hypothetical protein